MYLYVQIVRKIFGSKLFWLNKINHAWCLFYESNCVRNSECKKLIIRVEWHWTHKSLLVQEKALSNYIYVNCCLHRNMTLRIHNVVNIIMFTAHQLNLYQTWPTFGTVLGRLTKCVSYASRSSRYFGNSLSIRAKGTSTTYSKNPDTNDRKWIEKVQAIMSCIDLLIDSLN